MTYIDRVKQLTRKLRAGDQPAGTALHLFRLCFMIGMSWIALPAALLLKIRGYRFVNIDLAQIGSAVYLDLLLREDRLERQTPRRKIFVLASDYTDGNRYVLDLYNPYVTYIRNPFIKFLLSPFFVSPVFDDNSFNYDYTYHRKAVAHDIWQRYEARYKTPLIAFPHSDMPKAEERLAPYVPKGEKFITLHVRDTGFYGIESQNTRNADIRTYEKSIRFLIEKGYYIVRLGDPHMVHIDDMVARCDGRLFDYAHSRIKSEMMDCYLLSHCAFFIGLASGPSSVPPLFGVNCCNVNWYNLSNAPYFLKGDLAACKRFRYKKDDRLVPLETLMLPPFSLNPRQQVLDEIGVWVQDNTEDEIYETVAEYLAQDQNSVSDIQMRAKNMIRPENYAYGAQGHFAHAALKVYFER